MAILASEGQLAPASAHRGGDSLENPPRMIDHANDLRRFPQVGTGVAGPSEPKRDEFRWDCLDVDQLTHIRTEPVD